MVRMNKRGQVLRCKGWEQEAALRMLENNLDSEVAEDSSSLVVYGGRGKAARNASCLSDIKAALYRLGDEETLLVQSGKAVGIFPTHKRAPRVLIANANLVPKWATWSHFDALEKKGLMMYGQMTAGSWIYIGSQGILQGTYEVFAEVSRRHFGGTLQGRLVVSAGLGGMGGAQPLSVTMNQGVALMAEVDPSRIEKRTKTRYLDEWVDDIDEGIDRAEAYRRKGKAVSVGVCANAVDLLERLLAREISVDILTDQTSAHDPWVGYIPHGYDLPSALRLRTEKPKVYASRVSESMCRHVSCMLAFQKRGSIVFDYGNNLRARAYEGGVKSAFDFPGFVPAYIRPLFCQGRGPFRWVSLGGDGEDIYRTDSALKRLFPEDTLLHRWLDMARKQVAFQGLPARICWLGMGERAKAGLMFNAMVQRGELSAPIVIGRDHLDTGSVASPYRETEKMKDGSDAVADWPILNALLNTASGASWVSFHHGGGVGMGYSLHAGMVVVADGSALAEEKLRCVLHNDPAIGVLRHADAGYSLAQEVARDHQLGL